MAKVASIFYFIGDTRGSMPVNYRSKSAMFNISLPAVTHGVLKTKEVWGKTQAEVEDFFRKKIDEYKKALTTKKRVILYTTHISLWNEIDDSGFGGDDLDRDLDSSDARRRIEQAGHLELHFAYNLGYETDIAGTKSYTNEGGDTIHVLRGEIQAIEWTAEREEFFKTLRQGFNDLAWKLHHFVNNETNVLKLIAKGGRLLPLLEENKNE